MIADYPGISFKRTPHGIGVLRLHYSADPEKGGGEKLWVPEENMHLSPWAFEQWKGMTNKNMFRQEFEIDAEATLGALLYEMDEQATLEESFAIPETWTRRMSLDPHPGIPHAFLWVATDPWGDRWYYRELWPSKVGFRYEGGRLLGKSGLCPSDDNRIQIKEYVECMKWLESDENPQNVINDKPFTEDIFQRVIDYAARAFGKGTNDDPEQENFQQRYEKWMVEMAVSRPYFDDAKKDHDSGFAMVNAGLKPREVMGNDGKFRKRSSIHIFKDRCPELVHQVKNVRLQTLSATQALRQDPTGQPVAVRNHQADNLRYLEMANPVYIKPQIPAPAYEPAYAGTSY